MAKTTVPQELSSTPNITDNGTATAITIDSSQNVGIGTSSPDVFSRAYTGTIVGISSASGESAFMINSSGTNVAALELGRAGARETLIYDTSTVTQIGSVTSKPVLFTTGGTERMRIDTSGNLLINDTSGSGDKVYVGGKVRASGGFKMDGGTEILAVAAETMGFYTNTGERMRLDPSGNLLLGTTTNQNGSGARFSVVNTNSTYGYGFGTVSSFSPFYVIPGVTGGTGAGVYLAANGSSWTSGSDETLKENIEDIGSVLNKISSIRTVKYNLIGDEDKKIGFIAQDWINDFPEVVTTDERTGKLGIQYTETIAVLMKAIQEQQTIIDDLKARIETLEGA